MRMGWRSALLAVVLVAACNGRSTEPEVEGTAQQVVEMGATVRLKIGEAVRIAGTQLTVSLRSVRDSRCPIDALCVWPGDAEVTLHAAGPGLQAQVVTLHTFTEPKAAQVGGYTIRLVEVSPPPVSTRPTEPQDFMVALEVTR